jgi:hypothetical protein
MVKNRSNKSFAKRDEPDSVAMEAARELSPEFLTRSIAIMERLPEEEQVQAIENLLEEMNFRINEIYQRKKQERSN